MSQKLHVKTGDTVVVISGKDKGKQGKITAALPKKGRVVVEGVNVVKRHTKPTQANPTGSGNKETNPHKKSTAKRWYIRQSGCKERRCFRQCKVSGKGG